MRTYNQLLEKLFHINLNNGVKLGLQNCQQINALLAYPDKKFKSIHIAGSNGKGSVATKIATGLEKEGFKVGLFTSPHISTFRERIRINGTMISVEEVEKYLSNLFALTKRMEIPATFFEYVTSMALKYFADKQVDYAVFETGLGGRFDATNIIKPELCVITSICLEHTELLGSTVEEIGFEKAGIIKQGIPVVLGPRTDGVPLPEHAPFCIVPGSFTSFEIENQAIAQAAMEELSLSENAILKGIKASISCRLETFVHCGQTIILDGAHNPDAFERLFHSLKKKDSPFPIRIVCGLSKGKDLTLCLDIIQRYVQEIHLVAAPNGRGVPPEDLKSKLLELGVCERRVHIHDSVDQAVREGLEKARNLQEVLLVCGTFFIMSEARKAFGFAESTDSIEMNERIS